MFIKNPCANWACCGKPVISLITLEIENGVSGFSGLVQKSSKLESQPGLHKTLSETKQNERIK